MILIGSYHRVFANTLVIIPPAYPSSCIVVLSLRLESCLIEVTSIEAKSFRVSRCLSLAS